MPNRERKREQGKGYIIEKTFANSCTLTPALRVVLCLADGPPRENSDVRGVFVVAALAGDVSGGDSGGGGDGGGGDGSGGVMIVVVRLQSIRRDGGVEEFLAGIMQVHVRRRFT